MAIFSRTRWFVPAFDLLWGAAKSGNHELMISLSRSDWMLGVVRSAVVLGLLLLARRWHASRAWAVAVVVLLVADLAPVGFDASPRIDPGLFTRPPVAATLDGDRQDSRIFHEADWYGSSKTARKYFSTGDAVYWIVRNGLFPMTPAGWGFETVLERDYDRTALLPTVDLVAAMWRVRDAGQKRWAQIFMQMSNAHYRSEYRSFEAEKKRVNGHFKEARPVRFVRETSAPRFYFADQIVPIDGPDQFVQKLTREQFPARVAFVGRPLPSVAPGRGSVKVVEESPARIRLQARSEGSAPSLLVVSITPHRFWKAWVDDQPVRLLTVNLGYQGLVVPPGTHRIRMVYRNPIVDFCLFLTLLSMMFLAVLVIRRGSPEPEKPATGEPEVWRGSMQSVPQTTHANGMAADESGSDLLS